MTLLNCTCYFFVESWNALSSGLIRKGHNVVGTDVDLVDQVF